MGVTTIGCGEEEAGEQREGAPRPPPVFTQQVYCPARAHWEEVSPVPGLTLCEAKKDIQDGATREELLNIRTTIPTDISPVFLVPAALLVHFINKKVRRRRRGKRAGVLVRLRTRGTRTPLPGIFLSNVRSLSNKMDEIALLMRRNRLFLL
ncbi:hypothetical protein SRHO_G00186820 [Serrasalmus rhombeus]